MMIQSQLKCIIMILLCPGCYSVCTYESLNGETVVPMLGFLIKNHANTIDKTYYYCGDEFCTERYTTNYHSIVVIIET